MRIDESIALVTGANRGIGSAFVQRLAELGAAKIYAAARNPLALASIVDRFPDRIVPVELDITDAGQVAHAAERCADVNLLINNAGVAAWNRPFDDDALASARMEFDTNFWGTVAMARAFAPVLRRNGGGTMANVLTFASFVAVPSATGYCASKAAAHSLTQCLRAELAGQGTDVFAIYPGPVDTDMIKDYKMPDKVEPREIAVEALDALQAGKEDYFARIAREAYADWRNDYKRVERDWAGAIG